MSYLIIGGTKEERKQKAQELSNSQFLISNFDTISVEGETSIGIDQIRALGHQLSLKPYNSPAKAAIIHPGEILTIEAQNALLKTLEGPPAGGENSILILTVPQIDALLPTVVSRCQIIRLPSKSEITLTKEEFESVFRLLSSVLQGGVGERLKFAARLGKNKEEVKMWLGEQIFFWREILLYKLGVGGRLCKKEFKFLTAAQIIKIIKNLEKTRSLIEQNVNPRLALEVFLLDLPKNHE